MNKKADYLKLFKPCLIAFAIVMLVAALVTCIFGFNKSVDFVGGHQLVVNFDYAKPDIDIERQADFDKASQGVSEILNKYNARVYSFQIQGEYGTRSFVITVGKMEEAKLNSVRVDINKAYNKSAAFEELVAQGKESEIVGQSTDLTLTTSNIDGFINAHTLLITISSVVFALTLLMIYTLFRFRLAGGLSLVFGAGVDILATLAFVSLARIQVTSITFVAMCALSFIGVYATTGFLFRFRELSRDPKYASLTNYELCNLAVDIMWKKDIVLYGFALIMTLLICGIAGLGVLHLGLTILAGLVVILASHTFMVPAVYAMINKNREKIAGREQTQENKVDKDAEVIEIKE